MKPLFIATAALETGTGLMLIVAPATVASLLLGATLDAAPALTVARVAGAALLALGLACWLARTDVQSHSAGGLLTAMFLYNAGAAATLAYAGLGFGLFGTALWPAVTLHLGLLAWCGVCWLNNNIRTRNQ